MEIARKNINTLTACGVAENINIKLEEIEAAVSKSIKNLRKVLDGLPVWDTASFSFETNIKNMVHEIETHIDARVEITILGLGNMDLSTEEMEQLLSIMHEALYNSVKHSKASVIKVKVLGAEGKLKIIVHDDGVGFSPLRVNTGNQNHIGLLSMKERAWTINADFVLKSSPGLGTKVIITLDGRDNT
jgi:signal transduction histidine kinase